MTPSSPPPPLTPTSTFGDLLDRWYAVISSDGERTTKTVARYRRQRQYLAALFDVSLDELTRPRILDWHEALKIARGISYADHAAMVLHVVLEYAWDRGLVPVNNASRMKLTYEAPTKPSLTPEQWSLVVGELLDLFSERHDRAVKQRRTPAYEFASTSAVAATLAMCFSGPRQDEISRSKCAWWNPHVMALKVPDGKTGQQNLCFGRHLGAPFITRRICEARALGFEHLFPTPVRERWDVPITTCAMWDTWTIACGRAGVRGISPHSGGRRTAAVASIEEGMPDEYVQRFLNHRELKTTDIYTRGAVRRGPQIVAETLDDLRLRQGGPTVDRLLAFLVARDPAPDHRLAPGGAP